MENYRRLIFVIIICLLSISALIKWNIIRDNASVVSMGRARITGTNNNMDEDFNRNIANILNILQTIQQNSNCNHDQSAVDSGIKFLTTLKNKEIMNLEACEKSAPSKSDFIDEDPYFHTNEVWRTDKSDWRDNFYPGTVYTGEVCGETLVRTKDTYPDWPYFKLKDNCVNKSAEMTSKVVTILLNIVSYDSIHLEHFSDILDGIYNIYPGINTIVTVPEKFSFQGKQNIKILKVSNKDSAGTIWNNLVKEVNTPYVFIGRDLVHFDSDSQLERLIRELSPLKVPVMGGAIKTPSDGHWFNGCHQMAHRNYTLVYKAGYKHSAHDCLYCHTILGPFVANTSVLKDIKFHEKISEDMLFNDYFFKLFKKKITVGSCPDVLFLVRDNVITSSQNRKQWLPMVSSNSLNKVVTVEGKTFTYTCEESKVAGKLKTGYGIAPCKLQKLTDKIKFVMKKCREHNILCVLNAGTAVGALKVNSVLPWEKDADILYYYKNSSAMEKLKSEYKEAGYTLNPGLIGQLSGKRIFYPKGSGWKIDLYPFTELWTEELKFKGEQPTKILLDGDWVEVPRNIGRHIRNRYGPEIYKHVQHSMELNKKQFTVKTGYMWTGHFTECTTPGAHDCLDQYKADGNLQFSDPVV